MERVMSKESGVKRNGETEKRRNGENYSPIPRFSDSPIHFLFLLLFTVFYGCALPRHYVQPNPANPIKTVAVLPMANHTNDVEGPETVREIFANKLTERCYFQTYPGSKSDTQGRNGYH